MATFVFKGLTQLFKYACKSVLTHYNQGSSLFSVTFHRVSQKVTGSKPIYNPFLGAVMILFGQKQTL